MKTLKEQIIDKLLSTKPSGYILQDVEEDLLVMMEDVVRGLLSDMKYLKDENKRLLNEKLNSNEIIEELYEQIDELKEKINDMKDGY